jgi:hypothetical protein
MEDEGKAIRIFRTPTRQIVEDIFWHRPAFIVRPFGERGSSWRHCQWHPCAAVDSFDRVKQG